MPAAPAPLSADRLADYAAMDLSELMNADAAAVVGRVRDRLIAEIARLQAELGEEKRRRALNVADLRWGIGQVEERCRRLEADLAAASGTEAGR